jgi:DNA-directed RNA polymerase specialized sigma24 family protein
LSEQRVLAPQFHFENTAPRTEKDSVGAVHALSFGVRSCGRLMAQGSSQFETTLWSQVLLAGREPNSADGQRALARLCELYWYPVYAFIRGKGISPDDAKDLTQGFFHHILANDFLARADPERGRFRGFLLGAARNFISNEYDRARAQRRGGLAEKVPIDVASAEDWLSAQPSAGNDAALAFDKACAHALAHHALAQLEQEQTRAGKEALFAVLKGFLTEDRSPEDYDQIATKLNKSSGAVKVAVHRLRQRYGEILRKCVRDSVASPDMAEAELEYLFEVPRR